MEEWEDTKFIIKMVKERAMFGAVCFWGVESAFMEIQGVDKTEVGFSVGHTKNPSYKDVCSDITGHAEFVLIEFDNRKVSYEKLLEVFWKIHDPMQKIASEITSVRSIAR